MATAKTKKQKSAIKELKLKDGWKPMKNFGRYAFYKNGKVYNRATGNEIFVSLLTSKGDFFQLTNDKGKRERISTTQVKELFKEAPQSAPVAAAVEGAPKAPPAQPSPGGRGKAKLDYTIAMDIRRRLANGEQRGVIAKEYGVDPWTIQAIAINYSYKIKEGDTNPIPAELMERFTATNLPASWKGKSREEIRALAGFVLFV